MLIIEGQNIQSAPTREGSIVSLEGKELISTGDASWRTGLEGGAYAVDPDGKFELAITAPEFELENGQRTTGSWKVVNNRLMAQGTGKQLSGVRAKVGVSLISSVKKSSEKSKPRYIIKPTSAGRVAPSSVHASVGWSEAKRKGVDKPTRGLKEQYVCHPMSKIARVKATWNIEAWRPTVGIVKTVAARCNPK